MIFSCFERKYNHSRY